MACALDPALVDRVRRWLESGEAGTAWLTGHSGSGMTSMIAHLTRDMEPVWLTPSDLVTRAFLKAVCSHRLAVTGKRKVLVLDELDVVLGNEASMAEVAFLVKHNRNIPVVCILRSNRVTRTCSMTKKASLVVDFPPPTTEAMVEAVTAVAEREGLDVGRVRELCERTPGDIRHVLQTLRAGTTSTRDVRDDTQRSAAALFEAPLDVDAAVRRYQGDAGALPDAMFETYYQAAADVGECAAYLELASVGDLVDEHATAREVHDMADLHGALAVAGAGVVSRSRKVRLTRHGVMWNHAFARKSKEKSVQGIRLRRGDLHMCPGDMALIRAMVAGSLPDLDAAAGVCRAAGLDAPSVLALMRLWDSGYKLSTHNKLKKLL